MLLRRRASGRPQAKPEQYSDKPTIRNQRNCPIHRDKNKDITDFNQQQFIVAESHAPGLFDVSILVRAKLQLP